MSRRSGRVRRGARLTVRARRTARAGARAAIGWTQGGGTERRRDRCDRAAACQREPAPRRGGAPLPTTRRGAEHGRSGHAIRERMFHVKHSRRRAMAGSGEGGRMLGAGRMGAARGRQPRASRAPGHRPESRRGRPDAQRAKKTRRPRAGWARGGARPGRRKGWAAETPTINVPASPAGGLPGCGQRGSRGRGGTRPVAARRGQAIPARHQAGPRPGGAGRVPRGIRPGRAGITGRAASPADAGAGTSSRPAG